MKRKILVVFMSLILLQSFFISATCSATELSIDQQLEKKAFLKM